MVKKNLILHNSMKNMQEIKQLMKEIYFKIDGCDDREMISNIILEETIAFIKFSGKGSLLMINEEGEFEYAALKGYPEELKKLKFKKEELYLYKINNFKEPAIINKLNALDKDLLCEMKFDVLNDLGGLDIKSTVSFPIHVNGEVIAIMNLDSEDVDISDKKEDRILYNQIKYDLNSIFENYNVREKLTKLANVDELTGLMNKRQFKNILTEEIQNVQESLDRKENVEELIVVFLDLDNFKSINDEKGHYFGDMALQYFSNLLKKYFADDIVSRIYGDEFAVLCKNKSAEEVREEVDNLLNVVKDKKIKTPIESFSYGIREVNHTNCHKKYCEIMSEVDQLMYEHKKSKKKRLIKFNCRN